ncbi:MAG: hypothetical protein HN888_08465 [Desulfobacula sp.]|nr:hypothetical protein [Desulfobacula sp.]
MTDKKKNIKTIALVLISIIFLFMFYTTFFKAKKNSNKTAIKKQVSKVSTITIPPATAKTAAVQNQTDTFPVSGDVSAGDLAFSVQPFKSVIPDIFKPYVSEKIIPIKEKEKEKPKLISNAVKKLVKILESPPLSDQEKMNISQELNFTGSILSSKSAVAIINNEFIHVGDKVNGYKVASISEQQVTIDTGRGKIILEIMTHE